MYNLLDLVSKSCLSATINLSPYQVFDPIQFDFIHIHRIIILLVFLYEMGGENPISRVLAELFAAWRPVKCRQQSRAWLVAEERASMILMLHLRPPASLASLSTTVLCSRYMCLTVMSQSLFIHALHLVIVCLKFSRGCPLPLTQLTTLSESSWTLTVLYCLFDLTLYSFKML